MQFLNRVGYFLVASNLIISISGGFLTYGIVSHFLIDHAIEYALVISLLTFSVYNFQRIIDRKGFSIQNPPLWGKYHSIPIILSSISLIIAVIMAFKLFYISILLIVFSLIFGLISLWYTTPIFGLKLREVPGLKIVVTSLTWGYACAFFPLVNEGLFIGTSGLVTLLIYIYFVAIIIPFDIRDMQVDNLKNSTLPQLLGTQASKVVGVIFLIVFVIGNLYLNLIQPNNVVFYLAVLIQLLLLIFTNEKSKYYYFGLIDFSIIVLGISYLI
ncbi:MAG: hypothetical protein M9916_01140 [Crocinitomicaceae bacterium]|nr:hypothetical protein [Crocinitomicaceae bacterium]